MRPVSVASLLALLVVHGRADPPVPTLHAETRVVQIDVVVTDSRGKPVTDLRKQDFSIFDNGNARGIDIFSVNSGEVIPAPSATLKAGTHLPPHIFSNRNPGPPYIPAHSTVILLDQVSSNPAVGPGVRNTFQNTAYAQRQVIDLMSKVKPDEQIALYVIAIKQGLVLLQDYTTDRELLIRSLKKYISRGIKVPPETHPDKPTTVSGSKRRDPNEVPEREMEYLRVEANREVRLSFQAVADHLGAVPGRKSVYWVSEGFAPFRLRGMEQFGWDKTITALNEANVAVNAVDSVGAPGWGYRPPGSFQEIAESTGGQALGAMRNDMDTAIAEAMDASRTTYTLAFYLTDSERDDKFHTLTVKADRPGLQLFYRQGYYAGNTELPEASSDKDEPESVLLNRVDSTGVGITARVDVAPGTPRGTVGIRLNLDPGTLSLKEKIGGWSGKVEETFIEASGTGNTLAKVSDVKEFEVTSAGRAQFDKDGVAWPFSMPLMPGATKITIVVRDTATGHVGSLTVPLN